MYWVYATVVVSISVVHVVFLVKKKHSHLNSLPESLNRVDCKGSVFERFELPMSWRRPCVVSLILAVSLPVTLPVASEYSRPKFDV